MKPITRSSLAIACASVLTVSRCFAADPEPGYVDFGKLAPSTGRDFVEVQLKGGLLSMAARIAKLAEPEVGALLQGLHQVRVNVVGLGDDNLQAMTERVQSVRTDLNARGWERLVGVRQKDSDVGVYLKTRADEAVEGLVITVLDGRKQAVFINIVGNIKPEQVAKLGERLDIDPLKKAGEALQKEPAPADGK